MKRELLLLISILYTGITVAQKPADTLSLYFSHNSHTPTATHIRSIDSITNLEKEFFRKIDVIGYTNNVGSSTYNLKLSKQRANSIADLIHFHNRGQLDWKGELTSASKRNRKVDLIIHYEEIIEVEEILELPTQEEEEEEEEEEEKKKKIETILNVSETTENTFKSLSTLLSETKVGDKIRLKNITFIGGRDVLLEKSYYDLYKLLRYLERNPNVTINIQGHICCGSTKNPEIDGINNRTGKRNLSVARAKRVYKFLRKNGIKKSRMTYEGLANLFPQGEGYSPLDRRVEIIILSK